MKTDKTWQFLQETSISQLVEFYDLLPDILFWIKDKNSDFIYANKVFIEHLDVHNLEQAIGKNDYAFSPKHLAEQYINDDKKVMQGEKVTDRIELNIGPSGEIAWYSTSKRCLLDSNCKVIGTYGFTRHLTKTSKTLAHVRELEVPITYISEHYANEINIEVLAQRSHLSVSALERRFKKHLGKTPKRFINDFRLEKARKLLVETKLPIAQIGYQVGFSEPSYFSKMFKQLFNILPSDLRTQYS